MAELEPWISVIPKAHPHPCAFSVLDGRGNKLPCLLKLVHESRKQPMTGSPMKHLIAQLSGMGNAMGARPLPSLWPRSWSPCIPPRLIFLCFVSLLWWQHALPPLVPKLTAYSRQPHLRASTCWCGLRLLLLCPPQRPALNTHTVRTGLWDTPRPGSGHHPLGLNCSQFSWERLWSRKSWKLPFITQWMGGVML